MHTPYTVSRLDVKVLPPHVDLCPHWFYSSLSLVWAVPASYLLLPRGVPAVVVT